MRLLTPKEIAALPARLRRPVLKRHRIEGGRGEIYPYDEWADGEWRELTQSTLGTDDGDFEVTVNSFYSNMKQWAKRNGNVALQIRSHEQNKIIMKLGPYNDEQKEIRRHYVHPSEVKKS